MKHEKKLKTLPLGKQTFKDLIEENNLYVDKTKEIFQLLNSDGKYYFVSRPRRFGKSLFISTLKEIFLGNQKLFKDLYIYDKIEWKKYPVIHLDFSGISYESPNILRKSLNNRVIDIFKENNLEPNLQKDYKDNFKELLIRLAEKEKVVILIDEYDKPLVEFVDKPEIALENRTILKNFYEVLKESDQYLRFVMLTGVSRFSKISVFSGLNNLRDLTLSGEYATLFGYTNAELESYFQEYFDKMAKKLKITKQKLAQEIKNWYNGYSWDGENFVYNPFSILYLFVEEKISNYWFSSGTPTFLLKMIKKYHTDLISLEKFEADESLFDAFDIDRMSVESLLFQTGYLTIKKIVTRSIVRKKYILSYPNLEVKESLIKQILNDFTEKTNSGILMQNLAEAIEENNFELFIEKLKAQFASIPYDIFIKDREAYYHTVIYLILTLLGVYINAEVHTNKGRIDSVIETDQHIYILEFKLGAAETALAQIEAMNYQEKYLSLNKKITLLGIGFDPEVRNISGYLVKEL